MTYSSSDQSAYTRCREAAIAAGALQPQNWKERMAAGQMAYNGSSWANTQKAQHRLKVWTEDCLQGRPFTNIA